MFIHVYSCVNMNQVQGTGGVRASSAARISINACRFVLPDTQGRATCTEGGRSNEGGTPRTIEDSRRCVGALRST